MALAFLDLVALVAALAAGQQLAEPPVGSAVARVDQNVRRAAGEDNARAEQKLRLVFDLRIVQLAIGPHDAGERVVVGNADDGKTQPACLMHIVLRMRAATPELDIPDAADLVIAAR